MIAYLTIGAAIAGTIGLIVTIRNGSWCNTATAAFAAATALSSAALYSTNHAVADANIIGPGVPKGCFVVNANVLPTLILSCPVHVSAPTTPHIVQ